MRYEEKRMNEDKETVEKWNKWLALSRSSTLRRAITLSACICLRNDDLRGMHAGPLSGRLNLRQFRSYIFISFSLSEGDLRVRV